jgi:hypothetical protein
MMQPSELSPSGSRLCHLAWHTCNMYYIRIYRDIAKTKEKNGTIGSPSMALSPSTSVQGHRVDVLLSPIDPLSMVSHHFFTIFILAKTTEMQVRENNGANHQEMVTTHESISGPLGAKLIRVRRIGSSVVFYEDLDVT